MLGDEPEYVFDKLKGWVPFVGPEQITIETSYGRYTIINRLPEMDERYGVFSRHAKTDHKYRKEDGTLNIAVWAAYLKDNDIKYTSFAVRKYPLDNALYCTLIVEPYA